MVCHLLLPRILCTSRTGTTTHCVTHRRTLPPCNQGCRSLGTCWPDCTCNSTRLLPHWWHSTSGDTNCTSARLQPQHNLQNVCKNNGQLWVFTLTQLTPYSAHTSSPSVKAVDRCHPSIDCAATIIKESNFSVRKLPRREREWLSSADCSGKGLFCSAVLKISTKQGELSPLACSVILLTVTYYNVQLTPRQLIT